MLLARDFREQAREALKGKWALAVGTGFVAGLLGAYTALEGGSGSSSSSDTTLLEDQMASLPEEAMIVLGIIMVILGIIALFAMALALVQFIIGGAITLGYVKFNLSLIDGKEAKFSDLFSQFDRFGQAFLLQLLRSIFIFLWTLLLIIPGIIATYRYAMAPYIMAENPGMTALEAINESKRLMDGNKWRLFCLNFSFIGWSLLCVLTLGIGYLWLHPYYEAAYAAFYRDIKGVNYTDFNTETTSNYYENQNNYYN